MKYIPRPHDKLGIDHLLKNPRALLFSEMGTGKSGMALAALHALFADFAIRGALIVAPLRVATLQWPSEVEKWENFSWMKVADLRTARGRKAFEAGSAHLYVINYEMLPKFAQTMLYGRRGPLPFDVVIFDELTRCKNPRSKRVRSIRPYLRKMPIRWGMTGTPTPNSYLDLWAQAALVDDGACLGISFSQFRECYFQADYMGYSFAIKDGAEAKIREKLAPITLAIRAEDHLDIPPTHYEDVEVPLPAEIRTRYYAKLEKDLLVLLRNGAEVVAVNAAVLLNKLLQIVGGSVYDEDRKSHQVHDAKLKALAAVVRRANEPVLIACAFVTERARILRAIPGCEEWSDACIDRWNAGKIPAIVTHPASIGHGLNLWRGGRTVIWYSRNWQRELYDQLCGRFVGARAALSGRNPRVFHLVCPDTVDEAVAEALRQRAEGQAGLMAALAALSRMAN